MLLTIGFVICFLASILFAYLWIDRSVSLAYLDESYEVSLGFKRVKFLLENEWAGMSEHELFEKLKAASDRQPDEKIVIFKDDETNVIVFDAIEFELESGKLKRIK